MKDKDGNRVGPRGRAGAVTDYLHALQWKADILPPSIIKRLIIQSDLPFNLDQILMTELDAALRKTKNLKTAGPDGIQAELFKHLDVENKIAILSGLNGWLSKEAISSDFLTLKTLLVIDPFLCWMLFTRSLLRSFGRGWCHWPMHLWYPIWVQEKPFHHGRVIHSQAVPRFGRKIWGQYRDMHVGLEASLRPDLTPPGWCRPWKGWTYQENSEILLQTFTRTFPSKWNTTIFCRMPNLKMPAYVRDAHPPHFCFYSSWLFCFTTCLDKHPHFSCNKKRQAGGCPPPDDGAPSQPTGIHRKIEGMVEEHTPSAFNGRHPDHYFDDSKGGHGPTKILAATFKGNQVGFRYRMRIPSTLCCGILLGNWPAWRHNLEELAYPHRLVLTMTWSQATKHPLSNLTCLRLKMKNLRSPTFEVHYAPVLTFGSRAREIEFRNMKNAPAPRRDAEHPDGKPNLGPRDRARVKAANSVYAAGCRLILLCITLGARWSLEHSDWCRFHGRSCRFQGVVMEVTQQ